MSAPLRFLTLAVLAWAGVRAATIGIIPGVSILDSANAEPVGLPPIVPTILPPIPPVEPYPAAAAPAYYSPYGYFPPGAAVVPGSRSWPGRPVAIPAYHYPAAVPWRSPVGGAAPAPLTPVPVDASPGFYSQVTPLEEWEVADIARGRPPGSPVPGRPTFLGKHLDRLQLSAWALLRGPAGSQSLASGGTLGGSQAGARLTYALDPRLAISLRNSAPLGGSSGGEVAAGLKISPLPAIPLSITAERRQRIGRFGSGRSAFALFAETGLYQRPVGWDFSLDAYAQAGIVGLSSRDMFADGGFTVMRPLYGPVSVGLGAWGGYQPGLYRIDAGPRASLKLRHNMRVSVDWRQRLAGEASPGSGPAMTLSADF